MHIKLATHLSLWTNPIDDKWIFPFQFEFAKRYQLTRDLNGIGRYYFWVGTSRIIAITFFAVLLFICTTKWYRLLCKPFRFLCRTKYVSSSTLKRCWAYWYWRHGNLFQLIQTQPLLKSAISVQKKNNLTANKYDCLFYFCDIFFYCWAKFSLKMHFMFLPIP